MMRSLKSSAFFGMACSSPMAFAGRYSLLDSRAAVFLKSADSLPGFDNHLWNNLESTCNAVRFSTRYWLRISDSRHSRAGDGPEDLTSTPISKTAPSIPALRILDSMPCKHARCDEDAAAFDSPSRIASVGPTTIPMPQGIAEITVSDEIAATRTGYRQTDEMTARPTISLT